MIGKTRKILVYNDSHGKPLSVSELCPNCSRYLICCSCYLISKSPNALKHTESYYVSLSFKNISCHLATPPTIIAVSVNSRRRDSHQTRYQSLHTETNRFSASLVLNKRNMGSDNDIGFTISGQGMCSSDCGYGYVAVQSRQKELGRKLT